MDSDAAVALLPRRRLLFATCAGRWIPFALDSWEADWTAHGWSALEVAVLCSFACCLPVGTGGTVSDHLHYSAFAPDSSPAPAAGRLLVPPPLAASASTFDAGDKEGIRSGLIHSHWEKT